nr:DinB family protein [uncultured Psychroserpens sp.]
MSSNIFNLKNLLTISCIAFFSSFNTSFNAQDNNDFINDFIERLENSRSYLILVAETMPEDKYNFKASPESLSFADNLMHIGFAIDWHSQSLLGGRDARDWKTDTIYKSNNKSKKEMIATIDKTFDDAILLITSFDTTKLNDRLDYFGLNRTKRQICLLLADHITHHRGQMLVYLRLNNLVPPRYVLFQ